MKNFLTFTFAFILFLIIAPYLNDYFLEDLLFKEQGVTFSVVNKIFTLFLILFVTYCNSVFYKIRALFLIVTTLIKYRRLEIPYEDTKTSLKKFTWIIVMGTLFYGLGSGLIVFIITPKVGFLSTLFKLTLLAAFWGAIYYCAWRNDMFTWLMEEMVDDGNESAMDNSWTSMEEEEEMKKENSLKKAKQAES